jgi:8-oxo-dGTP diphosphatase
MRLRNRIDYTEDAFDFLKNDQSFTMYELRKIFETVKGKAIDAGNFRKEFINKYINTGLVVETGETVVEKGRKAAKAFKRKK